MPHPARIKHLKVYLSQPFLVHMAWIQVHGRISEKPSLNQFACLQPHTPHVLHSQAHSQAVREALGRRRLCLNKPFLTQWTLQKSQQVPRNLFAAHFKFLNLLTFIDYRTSLQTQRHRDTFIFEEHSSP